MKCNADPADLKNFKIKIYPTEDQRKLIHKHFDLFRYVYNWTLERQITNYDYGGKFIKPIDLFHEFAEFRKSPDHKWLLDISINTCRHAILNAVQAFKNFFEKRAKFPKFKRKHGSIHAFTVRGERLIFKGTKVRFEGMERRDYIECKNHPIPRNARFYKCTISTDGVNYWLSVSAEMPRPMEFWNPNTTEPIGIDLGLKKLAVLSDGTEYYIPNTRKLSKRASRLESRIAKQARAKLECISKNQEKRKIRQRKTKIREHNIRMSYVHKMTREIVNKNPKAIVLETLDVNEMLRNKYLARDVSASLLYEIGRQIEYKSANAGIPVIRADRWYPSTKLCSTCGAYNKIERGRTYRCSICGLVMDRDLNAALNLRKLATDYE